MRNLIIVGPLPPPLGGVSVHLYRLNQYLIESSIPHKIINTQQRKWAISLFIEVFKATVARSKLRSKARHVDIVIHSSRLRGLILATLMSKIFDETYIYIHNDRRFKSLKQKLWLRHLARLAYSPAVKVLAVSQEIENTLAALVDVESAEVLPAFLPPTSIEMESEKEIGIAVAREGIPTVGWCGLVSGERAEIYNFKFFLNLLDRLNTDKGGAMGIVSAPSHINHPSLSPEFKVKLERNKIIWLPQSAPFVSAMHHMDLFLRPTTSDGDAISVREAIFLGVPVLASDVCERPEGCAVYKSNDLDHCYTLARRQMGQRRERVAPGRRVSKETEKCGGAQAMISFVRLLQVRMSSFE